MATKDTEKPQRSGRWKWIVALVPIAVLLLGAFVLFCNVVVTVSSHGRIYHDLGDVPENEVGLVLGTSPKVAPDQPNQHFTNRMEAIAELYQSGRIRHIIVSGAHNSQYYNEADSMEKALLEKGVPAEAITRDESGFRTLDSIVRAREIFGLQAYTIVTDDFHVARAVFLARRNGQNVIGYAPLPEGSDPSQAIQTREIFARVKAVLDLYFFNTQPRELGEPQPLKIAKESETARVGVAGETSTSL